MWKNNGKWFNKFKTEELFTEYIYSLMKQGKDFMIFPDNKQVLIDNEIDEWNRIHGINDNTERLIYHHLYVSGYVINYTKAITSVLVPFDVLKKEYNEFIEQIETDLN